MVKRIDFHIHTLSDPQKDNGFIFSIDWLKKYVEQAELDAIAITNHNLFNYEQYLKISEQLNIPVFPGMELSLETGHVNVIFNNDEQTVSMLSRVNENINLGGNEGLSVAKFEELFENLTDGIIVFESGKSNSLNITNNFTTPFFNNFTFALGVNNQWRFQKIKHSDSKYAPVLFSDAHSTDRDPDPARNMIPHLLLKNTFIQTHDIDFSQIKRVLKNKDSISILRDISDIVQIEVDDEVVNVATGLNLIVGRRGTGKTYFLKKVHEQYTEENIMEIAQFESAQQTKNYLNEKKASSRNEVRDTWQQKNRKQWETIKSHYEDKVEDELDIYLTELKRYANQKSETGYADKVSLFKETEFEINKYQSLKDALQGLHEVLTTDDLWKIVDNIEKRKIFIDVYNQLRTKLIHLTIMNKTYNVVNQIMKSVKQTIEKHTGVKQPPSISLQKNFQYNLEKELINKFMLQATALSNESEEHIGGYIVKTLKKPWKSASEFKSQFTAPKGTSVDADLIKPYIANDFDNFFNNLFSPKYCEKYSITSASDVVKYSVNFETQLKTESGAKASGGQEVAFGLMLKLNDAKNKDIVLVDEPEASLDNIFIRDELVSQLKELSKTTTVFVITHNSTLGTLLKPDRLIVTKYDDKSDKYTILSGDYTSHKLENTTGLEIPSYNDFVDAMEAGINTYKTKGEQYENLRQV